jgi:hypothetical protein
MVQCLNIKRDNTKDQCLTLTDEEVTEDEDTDTGSETEDHQTVSPGLKLFSPAKCNSPTHYLWSFVIISVVT